MIYNWASEWDGGKNVVFVVWVINKLNYTDTLEFKSLLWSYTWHIRFLRQTLYYQT